MSSREAATAESDGTPFRIVDGDPSRGLILLCDHASNRLPAEYATLGLAASEFERHIAYDPGAEALTRALAGRLGVPAVLSSYSRLLVDLNRGEDDPTLIMRLSDGAIVPGNAGIDAAERARRVASYYAPYHGAIAREIDRSIAAGATPALLSVHSFTPVWRGVKRPWQVGVLWDADPRIALPLIEALAADGSLTVGDNEPYSGVLQGDTLFRHGTRRGLAHALIEVRQDLIADAAGVRAWADRLAPILETLNTRPDLHEIREHGSRSGPLGPI